MYLQKESTIRRITESVKQVNNWQFELTYRSLKSILDKSLITINK